MPLTAQRPRIDAPSPAAMTRPCASCGAPVEPGDKFCGSCGASQPTETADGATAPSYFRCRDCGAEVAVTSAQRSYTCAFCDSNYVVEFTPEQTGRQAPEFVIGFAVTQQKAEEVFRRWLERSSFFRPGDLSTSRIEGKVRGAYIPFWSFSTLAESRWSASIGEYWYETETYTETENGKPVTKTRTVQRTEWWDLDGEHSQFYSGCLISGSRGLNQQDASAIQPFNLAALKRYEPFYLAGWLSEEYSVARDDALDMCLYEFRRREKSNVASFLPGDTYGKFQVETEFSRTNSDLLLLPVYLLNYRYGEKLYRFVVNGQTGKIIGEKPVSWTRVAVAAGVVAVTVGVVALLISLFGR